MNNRSRAYTEAGVDIEAGNSLVQRIKSLVASSRTRGVLTEIGGFGGLFRPDLNGMADPVLVASTDGVGTKLRLIIAWNRHETAGIDLVAMSVNDVLAQGAAPLFFLDYYACGKLDADVCARVISGVVDGCRQSGCALLGGETAEMPDFYPAGDYDVAGFCVGLADNSRLVDGSSIQAGDVIIGLASSGIHSNGFSLVRKILKATPLEPDAPFPGASGKTAADVLLAPTIIYVECVKALMRDINIKGMAHITGGGFYDNIPRVLPAQTMAKINFGSWTIPPVFDWIRSKGDLSWPEMLQIFNCGVGFVLVVTAAKAEEVIGRVKAFNIDAWLIGDIRRVERGRESEERVVVNFDK